MADDKAIKDIKDPLARIKARAEEIEERRRKEAAQSEKKTAESAGKSKQEPSEEEKQEKRKIAAAKRGAKQLAESESLSGQAKFVRDQEAAKTLLDAAAKEEAKAYKNLAKVDYETATKLYSAEKYRRNGIENPAIKPKVDPDLHKAARTQEEAKSVINSIEPVRVKKIENQPAQSLASEKIETINLNDETKKKLAEQRAKDLKAAADALGVAHESKGRETRQASPGGNNVASDEIMSVPKPKPIVPAEVERDYVSVNGKYYNAKNNKEAFEDKGNKLQTRSSNEEIASNLVKIAEARGWDEIKVSGTEAFRRAAWIEASTRGMQVKGYTPNEQDKIALESKIKSAPANTVEEAKTRHTEKSIAAKNEERAASFQKDNRTDALKKHPELAPAYAAQAAINKKMEQDGLTEAQRAYAQNMVNKRIIEMLQKGEIPNVKKREEITVNRPVEKTEERQLSR